MKKILLFVGAIIPLLVFVGLRRNSAPFFSVQEYHCVCPEYISESYFSSITGLLAESFKEKCSAHELIDRLKKQCPVLKKIVISYRPSAVSVAFSAYEPVCCINDTTILTAHHELFPKEIFSESAIESVAKITVLQEHLPNIPLLVSTLLHELPPHFNDTYNLELRNEHSVQLIDKEQPNFIIALTVAQKKLPLLLTQCDLVKKNINARSRGDKGVKWIADIRFADYIVAYKV